jgi:uncharacterized protein
MERICVGCGASALQDEMLRCALNDTDGLSVDVRGVAGRGAWLHPRPECIDRAVRGGFARSFRRSVVTTAEQVCVLVQVGAGRRLAGLFHAARSARHLIFGRDQVRQIVQRQITQRLVQAQTGAAPDFGGIRIEFAILAEDTGSLASEDFVQHLAASGKLAVWGTKEQHGQALGRGEVAILAFTELGLANQVARTLALLRLKPLAGGPQVLSQSARLSED